MVEAGRPVRNLLQYFNQDDRTFIKVIVFDTVRGAHILGMFRIVGIC